MSFWKRLFGGGASPEPAAAAGPVTTAEVAHAGFMIRAQPYRAEGGFQTAGSVEKDGREHRFVRADRFPSLDDATEFSLRKGRQIVDEQGDRLFG